MSTLSFVFLHGCFVVKLKTIPFSIFINVLSNWFMKWKMQPFKIYQKGISLRVFIKLIHTHYYLKFTNQYIKSANQLWWFFLILKWISINFAVIIYWSYLPGIAALCFEGNLLWNMIPNKYKNINTPEELKKTQIELWNPIICSSRIWWKIRQYLLIKLLLLLSLGFTGIY